MLKITGRVQASEFDLGFELRADDGSLFQLDGGGPDLLRPGVRAEVEGQEEGDAMGIAMRGCLLRVRRYRLLE
jgi:hypothetical protein